MNKEFERGPLKPIEKYWLFYNLNLKLTQHSIKESHCILISYDITTK